MLAIAEFSRNTSHSTSHAEWGIVLLSGGYVSFSPKSFGIYLCHAIHNCIGCKWNWRSGGSCFFIFALSHSLFHCWITNQHHLYHLCFEAFIVSLLLNAYSNAQMGSPQGQSPSSHHPQSWFCLGQFSFFPICRVCSTFVLSVVFSSQIVRGKYFGLFWFRYACPISSLPTCKSAPSPFSISYLRKRDCCAISLWLKKVGEYFFTQKMLWCGPK